MLIPAIVAIACIVIILWLIPTRVPRSKHKVDFDETLRTYPDLSAEQKLDVIVTYYNLLTEDERKETIDKFFET